MADYQHASRFSDVDKPILEYTTAISYIPVGVSYEFLDKLRPHCKTAQLVILTHIITLGNLRAHFTASGHSAFPPAE